MTHSTRSIGWSARNEGSDATIAFREPERAAQPDEPARLRLHPERRFVRGVGFDDHGARMFEDLLTDLGQAEPPRGPVQQPQQRDATADPRFWNA